MNLEYTQTSSNEQYNFLNIFINKAFIVDKNRQFQ